MTTATGVAAGALAFEGIESLMHGFGQHAGYGSSFDGGMGGGRPEEIINNNYYGDATPEHHGGDLSDRFAAAGDKPSDDIEDRRGFSDDTQPDVVGADDTADNFADTSSDDSGSFDDGGGFDSGGSDDNGF